MHPSTPATLPDVDYELPPAGRPARPARPLPHVDRRAVGRVGPVVVAAAVPPPLRAPRSREQPGIRDAEE